MRNSLGTLLLPSLLACGTDLPTTAEVRRPALYGLDDRRDAALHPDPALRTIAHESVLALVDTASLTDAGWPEPLDTLGDALHLCPGQRFADQPVLPFCTAVLVAPDQALTARHCLPDAARCASTTLVFDFALDAAGALLPPTARFACAALVDEPGGDVVRVQLDRAVDARRTPLPIATSWSPRVGDAVTVIGHPSGLPLKIDDGARVSATERGVFVTADAFGGSSGSPVLDARGALVGVLTAGNADYRDVDGCTEAIVYHPDERGEAVVRVAQEVVVESEPVGVASGCACVAPARGRVAWVGVLIVVALFFARRRAALERVK